jgi:hypothetical protein
LGLLNRHATRTQQQVVEVWQLERNQEVFDQDRHAALTELDHHVGTQQRAHVVTPSWPRGCRAPTYHLRGISPVSSVANSGVAMAPGDQRGAKQVRKAGML